MEKWVCKLEEDGNGDLILPIPDDLWEKLSWKVGDEIDFIPCFGGLRIANLSMLELPLS